MNIPYIFQNIPFFSHLTLREIQSLCASAGTKRIIKGEKIDLRKNHLFGIIIDGMFETGQRVRGDGFYLLPGSFFGEAPFTISKQAGIISAVVNSTVALLAPGDIYRALLLSFKGLKGYIKNIKRNGFEIAGTGNDFLKCGSKVIAFFSPYHNAGNSTLAAMAGLLFSRYGNTIILDASHSGNSIFNMFGKDMPPAISQKKGDASPPGDESPKGDASSYEDDASKDKFIYDRIVNAGENLSLLNISAGSRIKVNSEILSPVIFLLSRKYKYIIIDHSDYTNDFTNRILAVSDIVFPVLKSMKDRSAVYAILDSALKDGQRAYYILNRYFAKNVGTFEGGYMLEDLEIPKKEKNIQSLKNHIESGNKQKVFDRLADLVNTEKTGLVVQTNLANSVLLAGFFSLLYEKEIKITQTYSSSWSYLITALFLLCKDQEEFENNILRFFSESRINNFLEITFPEEHVYKNARIYNFACDFAGDKRLEHYSVLASALLADRHSGERRIFSTGYVRDIFTASFILDIFEPQRIANSDFHSGFSSGYVKPDDLLRTDINEIRCLSVSNRQRLRPGDKKLSKFYKGYVNGLEEKYNYAEFPKTAEDFIIDADVERYNIKEILKISKEICKNFKF